LELPNCLRFCTIFAFPALRILGLRASLQRATETMAKRTRRAASSAVRATSGASRNKVEKTKKAEKSTAKKGKGSPAKKDKAGAKTLEWPPSTAIEALSTQDQFKMVSWNVAGLRACIKKGFSEYVEKEQPDILCLNEVRCAKEDPDVVSDRVEMRKRVSRCAESGRGE